MWLFLNSRAIRGENLFTTRLGSTPSFLDAAQATRQKHQKCIHLSTLPSAHQHYIHNHSMYCPSSIYLSELTDTGHLNRPTSSCRQTHQPRLPHSIIFELAQSQPDSSRNTMAIGRSMARSMASRPSAFRINATPWLRLLVRADRPQHG